jgi:hypothetical protein
MWEPLSLLQNIVSITNMKLNKSLTHKRQLKLFSQLPISEVYVRGIISSEEIRQVIQSECSLDNE